MTALEQLTDIVKLNEIGDDNPYEFADPDGVRSGKSGWSFGPVQFDIANNSTAAVCLKECGFTDAEIAGLRAQTIDVKPLNSKLTAHADVIERYSEQQLKYCIDGAQAFVVKYHVPFADDTGLLAIADTINQYGSVGHGSAAYLLALGRPVTAKDVLAMKLTWKYAQASKQNKADTIRRYNNLMKVLEVA